MNNGTAVGFDLGGTGIIIRTTDGGNSWSEQSTPTIEHFYAVSFSSANTETVVGNSGTVLTTSDGRRLHGMARAVYQRIIFTVFPLSMRIQEQLLDTGILPEPFYGQRTAEIHGSFSQAV